MGKLERQVESMSSVVVDSTSNELHGDNTQWALTTNLWRTAEGRRASGPGSHSGQGCVAIVRHRSAVRAFVPRPPDHEKTRPNAGSHNTP